MGYTKRQIVRDSFAEIGLGDYDFDLNPDRYQAALRKLDRYLAQLEKQGIKLYYPVPDDPDESSLDEDSAIPEYADNAVIQNFALLLAPTFGKIVTPELRIAAKQGMDVLMLDVAFPEERQLPRNTPVGAGYKTVDYPFTDEPE